MDREASINDLLHIIEDINFIIDSTQCIMTSRSKDLMSQFAKTEIRAKGPLTLEEKAPLTKLQIAAFSIPVGKKGKEKRAKEISDVVEGYFQEKMQELRNEITKDCECDIKEMWASLENAGKTFESLLNRYVNETASSNSPFGSLHEKIKAEEARIPDVTQYDCLFDIHSFQMWQLTKDIPIWGYWVYVRPNPMVEKWDNMTHFYEGLLEPIAEYLEMSPESWRVISESFERLKSDLAEYGNQMIDILSAQEICQIV